MVAHNEALLVFGGAISEETCVNDFFVLSLKG